MTKGFLFLCCGTMLLQAEVYAQGVLPADRYYNRNAPTLTWDAITATDGQVSNASNTWAATTTWVKYPLAGSNVAWVAGSNALFGGNPGVNNAGTITISGTQSVRNLSFNPVPGGNFLLTGGTALSLTGGTSFINTSTGTAPTIAASLQGTNNVVKMGNGSLSLTGINSYSGNTDINLGTVYCSNSSDWGALPGGAVNVNAGVLNISASYPYFGTSGSNWQLNNNGNVTPTIASNVLTLTTNAGNQASSAFYKCKVRVDGDFTATFTYTPGGDIAADGVAFILQNSDVTALGGGGGSMGYSVITSSFGLVFNIYNGHQIGMNVGTNGAINYGSVSPVVLNSGNPINVTATYNYATKTLAVNLAEQNTTHTFSTTYTSVDLPATLGSVVGWIGFSGATGGSQSTQKISNFIFSDRQWNITVSTPPTSVNSGNITLGSAPNLAGKIFNIVLSGTGTGFSWTAASWTGTAIGTPALRLNGTAVTSGVASGGTTITYSATGGITVSR